MQGLEGIINGNEICGTVPKLSQPLKSGRKRREPQQLITCEETSPNREDGLNSQVHVSLEHHRAIP